MPIITKATSNNNTTNTNKCRQQQHPKEHHSNNNTTNENTNDHQYYDKYRLRCLYQRIVLIALLVLLYSLFVVVYNEPNNNSNNINNNTIQQQQQQQRNEQQQQHEQHQQQKRSLFVPISLRRKLHETNSIITKNTNANHMYSVSSNTNSGNALPIAMASTSIKDLEKVMENQKTKQQHGILYNYLEESIHKHNIKGLVLVRWNAAGILLNYTAIKEHQRWFIDEDMQKVFNQTSSSKHGKVALLYNADWLGHYNQEITSETTKFLYNPPVPVLFYTLPYQAVNSTKNKFILVPNPYDRMGQNEFEINHIQDKLDTTFHLTFDIYKQRQSTMVWRGTLHGPADYERNILVNMSDTLRLNTKTNDNNNNNSNSVYWLDAIESNNVYHKSMEPYEMIAKYKYHIDIGGVSGTSWGGLRWKMCSGALVFKLDTYSMDWWHDTIEPWEHYIPLQRNFKNVYEMYQWAEQNPQRAYNIARAGQIKCLETYSGQYAMDTMISIVQTLPPTPLAIVNDATTILNNQYDHFFPSKK